MRQRLFLLVVATLVVALAGCSVSLVNDPGNGQPTIALHPVQNLTPTPTALPYTIGAFANNETPNTTDSITIYVIFHLNGKPQGGATASLYFKTYKGQSVAQLNSQAGGRQTADDGWAAFPITFTALTSQQPILVDVTVSANTQTFSKIGAAFFTPVQPTPTPATSPGG